MTDASPPDTHNTDAPEPDEPFGHKLRRLWSLDPTIHFLNHGSFGATPRFVQATQTQWRERLEAEPVRFMVDELPIAWRTNRDRLARFVGAPATQTVLIDNATEGANAVLRSLKWKRGDKVVIANHAYPAVKNTVRFCAEREGIVPVMANVPWPLSEPEQVVGAYLAALCEGARLLIVDHVFSPLAVVTPLGPLLEHCAARGIDVLIDGAHAPGMLALDIAALFEQGATWYTGNLHKWLCAPKGAAFLCVRDGAERDLHPAVISNFYGEGLEAEFGWTGTRDASAKLSICAALDFIETLGAVRYRDALRDQAVTASRAVASQWGVDVGTPESAMGAMATLPLPHSVNEHATREAEARWRQHFLRNAATEVPVFSIDGRLWVRVSAQVYNEATDWAALADAFNRPTF